MEIKFSEKCILCMDDATICIEGKKEELGSKQFKCLEYLNENAGIILTPRQIYEFVWGEDYDLCEKNSRQSVSDLISKLRNRYPELYAAIEPRRGMGYIFHAPAEIEYKEKQEDVFETVSLSDEYRNIMPFSGKLFCERPDLVKKIDRAFEKERFVFITGVSGVGKSEIARFYGHEKTFRYVIPLMLHDDGSGNLNELKAQVRISGEAKKNTVDNLLYELTENDLIIVDNYNDVKNNIVYELQSKIPSAKFVITSQIETDDMEEIGTIISVENSDELEEKSILFGCEIFSKYADLEWNGLSESEKAAGRAIVTLLGNHTMTIAMLGRQFKKSYASIIDLAESLKDQLADVLKDDIEVNFRKDAERLTKTPYEMLKFLFKNRLILRTYSEIERQVLGAIVFAEKYTTDYKLIAELVGDINLKEEKYDVQIADYKVSSAKNAFHRLADEGIIALNDSRVYVHPLIKILICDSELGTEDNRTIAELSDEFYKHFLRNKLVERYTYLYPKSLNLATNGEKITGYSWTLTVIKEKLLPELAKTNQELKDLLQKEVYIIAKCKGETGASLVLHFCHSDRTYVLLNASGQLLKENRYYNPNMKEQIFELTRAHILICNTNGHAVVDLPDKVAECEIKTIGSGLLINNELLEHIRLPRSLKYIHDYAFCNCVKLQEIEIPDSVRSVGVRAFYNCLSLKKIVFGKMLDYIDISAFANCKSLAGELHLIEGMKRLHRYAFYGCSALKKVIIPESVKEIGRYCFSGCRRLEEVKIGSGVSHLAREVFSDCESLKEILIPETVKQIDVQAFQNCKSLAYVEVEEGVERIETHAFFACKNLKSVKLPQSIHYLGKAFEQCPDVVLELYEDSMADRYIQLYGIGQKKFVKTKLIKK